MTFSITLEPSGRQFDVLRDEPILAGAIRAGIGLPYGCRDGACGSCKSRLLQGRVIHGAHQASALTQGEEDAGLILTCCATPQTDCTLEARTVPGVGEHPVVKLPGRVMSMQRVAPDVQVLRIQLPGNIAFAYRAGQYVEFILRNGARRSYSMANAPTRLGQPPAIELHLRHLPGGLFTDQVFGAMKEKDIVRMEGPFGTFFLRDGEGPIILLASGTGFAPIKALVEHMEDAGIARASTLYWGGRRRQDLYADAWAREAEARLPWLRYVPVLSEPTPDCDWRGRLGFVHLAVMQDWPDLSAHEVYACGAPVMVRAAEADFTVACRLPRESFYADSFVTEADRAHPLG